MKLLKRTMFKVAGGEPLARGINLSSPIVCWVTEIVN
jgi:hypothetical protein